MKENCSKRKGSVPNRYVKALHCPTRWKIIEIIGTGGKSTKEIKEELDSMDEELSSSNLYYHLSELKKADIISVAEYREEGGGAPEKVWKLTRNKIVIELLPEGE